MPAAASPLGAANSPDHLQGQWGPANIESVQGRDDGPLANVDHDPQVTILWTTHVRLLTHPPPRPPIRVMEYFTDRTLSFLRRVADQRREHRNGSPFSLVVDGSEVNARDYELVLMWMQYENAPDWPRHTSPLNSFTDALMGDHLVTMETVIRTSLPLHPDSVFIPHTLFHNEHCIVAFWYRVWYRRPQPNLGNVHPASHVWQDGRLDLEDEVSENERDARNTGASGEEGSYLPDVGQEDRSLRTDTDLRGGYNSGTESDIDQEDYLNTDSDIGHKGESLRTESDIGREPNVLYTESDIGQKDDALRTESDLGQKYDPFRTESDIDQEDDPLHTGSVIGQEGPSLHTEPDIVEEGDDTFHLEPDINHDTNDPDNPDGSSRATRTHLIPDGRRSRFSANYQNGNDNSNQNNENTNNDRDTNDDTGNSNENTEHNTSENPQRQQRPPNTLRELLIRRLQRYKRFRKPSRLRRREIPAGH
ncbi:MAG: hypothetical protein M1831_004208 [Alyxoria varia]|nr:MAG: hypothetical protein M1831_004208 [Alyxoria varia]